jgi:potassium-transporting ATPase KdpC subunit
MRAQLLAALRTIAVFTLLVGLAYPLAVTGLARVAFHDKADGSLVRRDGRVVGSSLLGQTVTSPDYFQGRPSAAGDAAAGSAATVPGDLSTAASGPSNLGPTNKDLLDTVAERIAAYRRANHVPATTEVPVDAVTASASGVDPEISLANARLQAPRVARERGMRVDDVLAFVHDHTERRPLGILGEEGVDVLAVNLALDAASGQHGGR